LIKKNKKGINNYYITQGKTSLNYIMNELKDDSLKKSEKTENNNNKDKAK